MVSSIFHIVDLMITPNLVHFEGPEAINKYGLSFPIKQYFLDIVNMDLCPMNPMVA